MKGQTIVKKESNRIAGWVIVVLSAFIAALILRTFVFEPMKVSSGSMIPAIKVNDWFYVNKLAYKLKPVKRYDIIVFRFPDDPSVKYVKRVIGLGGDQVVIEKGKVYINGTPLNEHYLKEPMYEQDYGCYKVPDNHYFVLGDNRNDSLDSRFWTNEYVSSSQIIGKPEMIYWPLNHVSFIK